MDYVDQRAEDLRLALYEGEIDRGLFTVFASSVIEKSILPDRLNSAEVLIIGESHIVRLHPETSAEQEKNQDLEVSEILACFDLDSIGRDAVDLAVPRADQPVQLEISRPTGNNWIYRSRMLLSNLSQDRLVETVRENLFRSNGSEFFRIGHIFPESINGSHRSLHELTDEPGDLASPMTVVTVWGGGRVPEEWPLSETSDPRGHKDSLAWESLHSYPDRGEVVTTWSQIFFRKGIHE